MSKATRSKVVVYAVFSFLFFASIGIAAAAPTSVAPNRINIGSDDDPYYVEDTLALEAMKVSALAPSPASVASTVARLGSWSTGLTHTPGAGSNRLLIFAVGYENNSDVGVNAVTYGGQSLTRIGGVVAGTSSRVRTELWYLKEAGIAAAGSTTFVVTWGGSAPTSPKYGAATYTNVNQTTPIGHSVGTSVNASTPNPITATLNVFAGGMAVSDVFCGNTGSYTWQNSYVEGFDQSGSSSNMSSADRTEPATGSSIPSATHSNPNRQVLFAASLVPEVAASVFDSLNISQIDPSQFPHICTYVEAVDQFGNPIGGLTADSFCVSQDNNHINSFTVQHFTLDSCRTATCLVIDVSGSMASDGKITAAKNAAASFVRHMDLFDRAAIVKFSACYTVVQNFTGDTTLLLTAINGLTSGGNTAYFDGVWEGVTLTIPELGSKAVIHLTDGMENNSQNCGNSSTPNGLPDGFANDSTLIVNLALGAGIPLYGITLGGGFDPQYVQKLSYATGGAYYNAPTGAQLDAIYGEIKNRLCSRYLICYNSPDTLQNGDCHNVLICHHLSNGQCVDCDTANYCEKAPPVITRTPGTIALDNTCQRWGTQVQLCAYVTDHDTPLNQLTVTLFYRNSNLSPYTSVSTSRTDSTFCAFVPASQLVCGGDSIQYYFTASDGAVTVASPANAPNGHHAFPICPNHAPVCSAPGDTTIFQCTPTQVCLPVSATDQDNDLQGCAKTVGPGTLSGGQWCYTPTGSGMVSVTVRCTDSCVLYCEKNFNVTFNINTPPVCSVPRDTTIFQCTPAQVCLPVSASGNNPVCSITGGPGILSGGSWCYAPTGDQAVTVTVRCTDACGATCEKTFHVTFDINDAPVCSVPRDTTIFQCTPTQVCLPVSATDANGNLTGCAITNGPGTLAGGNWCYTPTGDQPVSVTVRCTDACGAYCEKTFQVTFDINDAPVCSVPRDTTIFQCAPAQICLPVSATDANGNLTGCAIVTGPGTLVSGLWCYMPSGDETANVTIRCTDACGAYCEKTFHVTFDINDAPVCSVPRDTTIFQCTPAQVCLPVSATDPNGNLTGCTIINGPGTITSGNWCYTPTGDQAVSVTVRCTDACGAYCEKTFHVTFDINDTPVCSVPRDTTIFKCVLTQVCLPVSATDANGNLTGCTVVNGPGTITGGNWCYAPTGDQTVTVTIRCTDACGAYCEKTFHVTFDINDAPVCSVPRDTTIFQCAPAQVCLPVSATDTNGNLTGCTITNGPGTLSGGYWCYTPSGDQAITVTIRCTDACGAYCEKTFHVTFDINDTPVCSVPRDTTIFQCTPTQVCLPVSATDANGNLTGCTIINGPGTITGGNWCYTPTGEQAVTVTIRCTDACGAYCEKTFHVTFDINDAPVCSVPRDTTIFQCTPAQVCLPVSATDANGNLTGCTVVNGPGTITGGNWCYTPTGDQTVTVTIRCTDACGAYCEKTFHVTFDINDAPVCSVPRDTTIFQCAPAQVCLPVSATDANGNLTGCTVVNGPGTLSGGNWCYTPTGDQMVTVTVRCTDACGAYCEKTFHVTFDINDTPVCSVPRDTTIFQCAPAQVCLPVSATDANGNLTGCTITNGPGMLSGGNWCYTPTGNQMVTVTIRCTDTCGAYCEKTFHVTFNMNVTPVCHVPRDTTIFQCAPAQVCLPVSATDADGNLTGCTVVNGPGTITGGNWCYTPTGDQTVDVTIRCTDACGATCEESFQVVFEINDPPTISLGDDVSVPRSVPQIPVCITYSVSDPNGLPGLIESLVSAPSGATIDTALNKICFTPAGLGTYTIIADVTDPCGLRDVDTVVVSVFQTAPPMCNLPNDTALVQCTPAQLCLPVTSTSQYPPVTCVIVTGPGTLAGGQWCYTPTGDETAVVTIRCTDALGVTCSGMFTVVFDINNVPVCNVPRDTTIFQCTPTQVCLPVSATDANGNLTGCTITNGPGTLAGGNWCYTPTGDQTVSVTVRCTDACGAYCEKTFHVTFDINDAPVCSVPHDTTIFQCVPAQVCLPASATDANGNLTGCAIVNGPGILSGGNWCYTPTGDEVATVTIRCTDACGSYCEKTFHVTFDVNAAPVCSIPRDTTIFQCAPTQVCLPVSATDADGNLTGCVITNGPGTLAGGNWCYTPTGDQAVSVTIRCTDACGTYCETTFQVTFDINDAPVCSVPRDTTIFLCAPVQVCLPVSATDANGNLTGCTVINGPGTITGGNWCYTPSGDQVVTVTIRCTDACGATCEKTFHVTFDLNSAPVCSVPRDTTIFQCSPTPVCLPVSATDADGNLVGCQIISGPGQLNGNWCYTPTGSGIVSVTIRCTDACGATCEKTFNVTFNLNHAPVCHLPRDTSIFQCVPAQVCLPVSATDVDGNLVGCQVVGGPGLLQGGNWCYTPAGSGPISVTIRCTDACGASCEGTFHVTYTIGQPPQITCPSNLNVACVAQVPPCSPGDVTVVGGAGHVTVTCSSNNNGGSGCASSPLIYTYTYTATDSCGAIAQCQRTVTVIDNIRPQLAGCPGNVTIECSDPVPPPATVTATDNCSQGATVIFSETPNLTGCGGYTGTITRRWIATDHCGNADTCIQVITKVDTHPPVCNIPSGPFNIFQCAPAQISIPVSATDGCDPAATCQVIAGLGTITNGNWVYTPTGNESFSVTVRCSDHCGNTCQGTFNVNIQLNAPPVIAFGADRSAFQCTPSQICENYTVSDPSSLRGATESLVSGPPGTTIDTLNNRVCFTPTSPGVYTLIAKIIDSCGVFDVDTINVNVTINSAPTIAFGNDPTVSQCVPASICVNYTISDPDGLAGSTQTLISGPSGATINPSAHMVCFTPSASGPYSIIARISDTCGVFDQDTININVVQNNPPICNVPRDTTILQCTPSQVCLPAGGSDPDGDPVICQKTNGPGQVAGGNWCYTPTGSQTVDVTLRCVDTCGAFCERTFRVTFDINEAPVCSVPRDTTILQCRPRQVCLPVYGIDPDGGPVTCQKTIGPGQLANGNWCYTPNGDQLVHVAVLCTDGCGASCEKFFSVTFRDTCAMSNDSCLMNISLGNNDGAVQALSGQQVTMPVRIESLTSPIGGFDLMICYDASAVGFLTAHQGEMLDSLKWEYFTYRHGPAGNCTGGCPSGIIHLVGIANMNNGVTPPSTAYRPIGEIAALVFSVSPDLNLINQCVPINFCWFDCGDNLVSDSTGDTAFVEYHLWVDTCQTSHKTEPIPAICFSGGWICIIPPPDDRGDINLNGVPNEVGDAVLFSNYFIFGPNVLHDPAPPDYYDNRVLATDINDDGTPLTIADLVYLIRIITGDAQPYPESGEGGKVAPYATTADVDYSLGEKMVVKAHSMTDVGGAAFIFRHSGEVGAPVLSDELSNMTLKFSDHNGELRVLVFSMNHQAITSGAHELFTVPMGEGTMELSEVQFSDAQGNLMSVNSAKAYVPTVYELSQNYPNPFNVSTVIRFALPKASDWTLRIYNVAGQMVDEFKGHSEVGVHSVSWNAKSASGIYFYKLVAGSFTDTKKMILMK